VKLCPLQVKAGLPTEPGKYRGYKGHGRQLGARLPSPMKLKVTVILLMTITDLRGFMARGNYIHNALIAQALTFVLGRTAGFHRRTKTGNRTVPMILGGRILSLLRLGLGFGEWCYSFTIITVILNSEAACHRGAQARIQEQ
jgi:hypothetical protein